MFASQYNKKKHSYLRIVSAFSGMNYTNIFSHLGVYGGFMENNTLHKLGIDIGSTTVKVAVLDEQDNLLFSDYERHFANIRETLSALLQKAYDA